MIELFDERFPADLSRMAEVREIVRIGLAREGVPEEFLERLVLVVDEVVSNSIEHGAEYRQTEKPIRVCVGRTGDGLVLSVDDVDMPPDMVADLAREFDEHGEEAPALRLERGRGMFLINMFLEDLHVSTVEGGGMRLQGRLLESRY